MSDKCAPIVASLLMIGLFSRCDTTPRADLVLTNGEIATVDSLYPMVEALAVVGDRIAALGTAEEIEAWIGSDTEILDLKGAMAMPGFIEGHGHFMGLGNSLMILDLAGVTGWDEIVEMVAEAVEDAEPGEWIQGRGWHQEKWDSTPEGSIDGVPTHHSLSEVSPENPVLLRHASGHAAFANQLAMRLAAISSETPDPSGGEIIHDLRGDPTGLLRETAQGLVGQILSESRESMTEEEREAERREQIRLAIGACHKNGITSFHDAGAPFSTIEVFKELAESGDLGVRIYAMIRGESHEDMDRLLPEYRTVGYGDGFLTVRAIKHLVDGALGAHGAWLLEPYEDLSTSTGLVLDPVEEIARTADLAMRYGYQVNTHAIGDRANREILDLYERVYREHPEQEDPRWRIEHAQHIHPDDLPRFAELGVIPSMQAIHCTSDAPWVFRRLGAKRAEEGAYMWRDLWDSGAVVTNGTDVPVERIDPIAGYYASVSRMLSDGTRFFPEQRMTREEALQSYTLNNAYAAFEEDEKGSLVVGKLADITVLSQNILTIEEEKIPETEVLYTIVGGEVVYENEGMMP